MLNTIKLYTDGACKNNQDNINHGGWGVYLEYKEHNKEFFGGEKNTTNNRMELKAVIEGLKAIKRKDYPVVIYTDSAYISDCFNQEWYKSWIKNNWKRAKNKEVLNKDLWQELLELKDTFKEVNFVRVPGHSGVYGNEKADQLANMGAEKFAS